jgi:transposase
MAPFLPKARKRGRPRPSPWRPIRTAIVYVLRPGGQWRVFPHALPQWPTGYHALWRWRKEPLWAQLHAPGRAALRGRRGREVPPRAGLMDRQRVPTTGVGGVRGAEGAKSGKGRQRPRLVETQGFGLARASAGRRRAGAGWGASRAAPSAAARPGATLDVGVARRGGAWEGQRPGLDRQALGVDAHPRAAPRAARPGVGGGRARPPAGLHGLTQALGGRTAMGVVGAKSAPQHRVCTVVGQQCSQALCRDASPDGATFGCCLTFSDSFLSLFCHSGPCSDTILPVTHPSQFRSW